MHPQSRGRSPQSDCSLCALRADSQTSPLLQKFQIKAALGVFFFCTYDKNAVENGTEIKRKHVGLQWFRE
ncbi:Nucleolar Protein 10 [Manis pentadactyla]|nr:Nucleolar Protein 10 [Manis pentadactyla]